MAAVHAPAVLLPGILMPARARFAPLMAALDGREAWPKELEVYAGDAPPPGYTQGVGKVALTRGDLRR